MSTLTAAQRATLDEYERFNRDVRSRPDFHSKWSPMSERIVEWAYGWLFDPIVVAEAYEADRKETA